MQAPASSVGSWVEASGFTRVGRRATGAPGCTTDHPSPSAPPVAAPSRGPPRARDARPTPRRGREDVTSRSAASSGIRGTESTYLPPPSARGRGGARDAGAGRGRRARLVQGRGRGRRDRA